MTDRYLSTRSYDALVEPDGTVRVYDSVAQHYSIHHTLSATQEDYIRRRARADVVPVRTERTP